MKIDKFLYFILLAMLFMVVSCGQIDINPQNSKERELNHSGFPNNINSEIDIKDIDNNNTITLYSETYKKQLLNELNNSFEVYTINNFYPNYIIIIDGQNIYFSNEGYLKYNNLYYANWSLKHILDDLIVKSMFENARGKSTQAILTSNILNGKIEINIQNKKTITELLKLLQKLDYKQEYIDVIYYKNNFKLLENNKVVLELRDDYVLLFGKTFATKQQYTILDNFWYSGEVAEVYLNKIKSLILDKSSKITLTSKDRGKEIILNDLQKKAIAESLQKWQFKDLEGLNKTRFPAYELNICYGNNEKISIKLLDENLLLIDGQNNGIITNVDLWRVLSNIFPIKPVTPIEELFMADEMILKFTDKNDTVKIDSCLKDNYIRLFIPAKPSSNIPEEVLQTELIFIDEKGNKKNLKIYDNYFIIDEKNYELENIGEIFYKYYVLNH